MPRNWAAFYRTQQKDAQRAEAEGQHRPAPYEVWPVDQDGNRVPPPWGTPGSYTDPSQYQEPTP